jgi:anti-anti-sigma factor
MSQTSGGSAPAFEVVVASEKDASVVTLRGELDLSVINAFLEAIDKVLAAPGERVIVVLDELTFIDSSGVRALLVASTRAQDRLVFSRPSPQVARVLSLSGLDDVLPIEEGAANEP